VSDAAERRRFAVPPATGRLDDIDLSYLDPDDPDERHLLIVAEHPELQEAIDSDHPEIVIDGHTVNANLHITMHELIANQLWDDDPPETWQTAQRLTELGYERHEVLHMLGAVVAGETWHMLREQKPFNRERFVAELDALPDSWEAMRG
jgi:hypothetical protein